MYFEDYVVDRVATSRGRTITESDIVNFAGLSGDFVELHMNEEYAKRGPFGRRIAHGALIFSISTGLMMQMTPDQDGIIAFYGVDKLRFVLNLQPRDSCYQQTAPYSVVHRQAPRRTAPSAILTKIVISFGRFLIQKWHLRLHKIPKTKPNKFSVSLISTHIPT